MTPLTRAETAAADALIELALREDLGEAGDLTSLAFLPADQQGAASFVARAAGVLAGLSVAQRVFRRLDPIVRFELLRSDGAQLQCGDRIATVRGPIRSLLAGERTALNFLQRLSGVATQTRRFVDRIAGLPPARLDTRKTTPGWRLLEKYAVRVGGGQNHRTGLFDMVLIKDNHLAALRHEPDPIAAAIERARRQAPGVPIEIEVDSLDQLDRALTCGSDLILLDNMTPEQLREAVRRRNAVGSTALLEASGGITLDSVRSIAETGIDRISIGALTHSAVALDVALDFDESN